MLERASVFPIAVYVSCSELDVGVHNFAFGGLLQMHMRNSWTQLIYLMLNATVKLSNRILSSTPF